MDAYKVINLASVGPGARAAQLLADLGADVIQVGAVSRSGSVQIEPAPYAYGAGRGVRKIRLDLKSDSGLAAFKKLIAASDVVIESFRPGVVKKLGIDYASLRHLNPRLIYCSVSGYGQHGPCSQWAGHDINYLAMSGFLDCSARDGRGVPATPGATVADSAGGGMQAVIAIQSALLRRGDYGEGECLDVSVTDGVLSMMSLHIDQYLATGRAVTAGSELLTGRYAWYSCYLTADKRHLSIGAIEPKFYRNLCRLLELDRYSDKQYDDAVQEELRDALQSVLLTDTRDNWVRRLAAEDTCVAPVLTVAEATGEPHFIERGNFQPVTCDDAEPFSQLAPVMAGSARGRAVHATPGRLHTDDVLREVGIEESHVSALVEQGVAE